MVLFPPEVKTLRQSQFIFVSCGLVAHGNSSCTLCYSVADCYLQLVLRSHRREHLQLQVPQLNVVSLDDGVAGHVQLPQTC